MIRQWKSSPLTKGPGSLRDPYGCYGSRYSGFLLGRQQSLSGSLFEGPASAGIMYGALIIRIGFRV